MADTKAVDQPASESESHEHWTRECAEEHMREFLASLPPPPSLDDLARAQGIKPSKILMIFPGGLRMISMHELASMSS